MFLIFWLNFAALEQNKWDAVYKDTIRFSEVRLFDCSDSRNQKNLLSRLFLIKNASLRQSICSCFNKNTSNVSVKRTNLSRRDSWSFTIVRLVLVFCSRQAPPTIRRRDRSPWKIDFWSWREAQTQKQITWKQKENRVTSVKATERSSCLCWSRPRCLHFV